MSMEWDGVPQHDSNHNTYHKNEMWNEKLVLWPRRCRESGTIIWPFRKAFRSTRFLTGPGTPIIGHSWLSSKSYIYLKLKGVV